MYEDQTFEEIMDRMLERVPNSIDKREGSLIWNALSPAAAEMAQMYIELGVNVHLSFADMATGDYLSRRTAEFGVNRQPATRAIRQGMFYNRNNVLMDVPIGSRFSIDSVNFVAVERISTGIYRLQSEQFGEIGNTVYGNLIPIQTINGLARAELTDVLIPGEEEETDEALRQRYYETVNEPAFSGNIADYKQKINAIEGVGATKVFATWDGGGTVKCTIIAANWDTPSPSLVNSVQTIIDPIPNQGRGIGLAPIDHRVTIAGAAEQLIDISTTIVLETGVTLGQVQTQIEEALSSYLLSLRQNWANEEQIVVRVAMVDTRIISVPGVLDVQDTTLNGSPSNVTLGAEEIPQLGTLNINE